jgi:hypothetical protein
MHSAPPHNRANQSAPFMSCAGEKDSQFCVCFDEEESPLCTAIISVAESCVLWLCGTYNRPVERWLRICLRRSARKINGMVLRYIRSQRVLFCHDAHVSFPFLSAEVNYKSSNVEVSTAIMFDFQKLHILYYSLQKLFAAILKYKIFELAIMSSGLICLSFRTHSISPDIGTIFDAAGITITHYCQMVILQLERNSFIPQCPTCKKINAI